MERSASLKSYGAADAHQVIDIPLEVERVKELTSANSKLKITERLLASNVAKRYFNEILQKIYTEAVEEKGTSITEIQRQVLQLEEWIAAEKEKAKSLMDSGSSDITKRLNEDFQKIAGFCHALELQQFDQKYKDKAEEARLDVEVNRSKDLNSILKQRLAFENKRNEILQARLQRSKRKLASN